MYEMNTVTNSYNSPYRVQYRLNKGTKLQIKYCVDILQAESFARFLLQDDEYYWRTIEIYDNQADKLIKTLR